MVRLIFLDDDLPLVNACKTTRLSTRWTHRMLICFCCRTLHFSVVNTALASSTLMCSSSPFHFQPDTGFHLHNLPGMPVRNLWCLTETSDTLWSIKSSPLIETSPASFAASWSLGENVRVACPKGGRSSRLCKCEHLPGVSSLTMSCTVMGCVIPKGLSNCCRSQATTPTAQEFPTKLSLQSSWAVVPWYSFRMHWRV